VTNISAFASSLLLPLPTVEEGATASVQSSIRERDNPVMGKQAKSGKGKSKAEHALADFFLNEEDRFVSFKQLKKKFGRRFDKSDLYQAVQDLVRIGFLEERSNQFRHRSTTGEMPETADRQDIIEGVLDVTQRGHAYVVSDKSKKDVWVEKRNLGNGLDGDVVKVMIIRRKGKNPEGKVVEVVRRGREMFVGVVRMIGNKVFVRADDRSVDVDFFIPAQQKDAVKHGSKVVIRLTRWDRGMEFPEAEVTEMLGKAGEHETEMQSILVENGFRLRFPQQVLQEAEELSAEIDTGEIAKRRDFRDTLTFTIDPADAQDFDDAISFMPLDEEWFEVGVHIADVSHYILPGSPLDREAYARATSVYLVDRCVPMLPEKLSNGICSLTPESDKLCFSAVFVMNKDAEISKRWFGKTVIHSKRRFTYEEAQEILEGKSDPFSAPLSVLNQIAKELRAKRFRHGSIDFESVEVKFNLDALGATLGVYLKERKDSNMLIEDFMLLANRAVCEYVSKQKGRSIPFVYRVHDLPDEEKLNELAELAGMFGYKLNLSTPGHTARSINKLMQQVKGKPEAYMLETLAIRTMAKAAYSSKNIGHYGLAFDYYTHFTSPIRRYPDLMVHRILQKVLNGEKVNEPNLEARCLHTSEMERKAAEAERTSIKLKQVEYMQRSIGQVFAGVISGVTDFGLFVITKDSYCEGLVRLNTIRSDYYIYEERKHSVVGTSMGKRYRLGDEVNVRLVDANLDRRTIDFELEEET
jgi:ribonuclease R